MVNHVPGAFNNLQNAARNVVCELLGTRLENDSIARTSYNVIDTVRFP